MCQLMASPSRSGSVARNSASADLAALAIASTCFSSDVDYCLKAGTSMATPQAAGLGALLYAMGLSGAEVLERMESTADDLGDPGMDDRFGHGRINVWRAINDLPAPPPNPPPAADFSHSCSGGDCAFTDLSSDSNGTVVGWSWTFGDGGTSSAQNPTHAYVCGGTYAVTLRATDDGGAIGTATRSVSVSVPAVRTSACGSALPTTSSS